MTRRQRLAWAGVLTYALAAAGGVIGYLPLLTLLLPLKVEALATADRYGLLAMCSIVGALVAGVANVAFGWLGDRAVSRGGGRRDLLGLGSLATALSYGGIVLADGAVAVVAAIVLFQIAINAVLAQVAALIAEEVPAAQKGTATALLTLGNPLAAGVSAIAVVVASSEAARSVLVVASMVGCLLPLILGSARPLPTVVPTAATRIALRRDLAVAWAARLLMQIAGSSVGLYLLFFFENQAVGEAGVPAAVARLIFAAAIAPVPIAFLFGRWSDRLGRRTPFLAAAAMLATVGLAGMSVAASWLAGALSYVAFASGAAVFVALNTGHAMLLLPDGERRGRDLGLLNLANTIPQIVAPLLAWWTATAHGFGAALAMLAALTLSAGLLPILVGGRDL